MSALLALPSRHLSSVARLAIVNTLLADPALLDGIKPKDVTERFQVGYQQACGLIRTARFTPGRKRRG